LSQNHPGLLVVRTNSARTRVELEWSEPVTHMELDEPKAREIAALILRHAEAIAARAALQRGDVH